MRFLKTHQQRMVIHKVWCCLVVVALGLSQMVVSVFADTNYCTTCQHGCLEHNHQGTPARAVVQGHCQETPRSCCALVACQVVPVDDMPFVVAAPEEPTPVGLLGMLVENIATIRLPEFSARWPHIETYARSAPIYLQNLSLLC